MAIVTFHLRVSRYEYFPSEMHSLSLLVKVLYDVVYLPLTQLDGGVIAGLKLELRLCGHTLFDCFNEEVKSKGVY
jgi:hypothetical protein